MNEILEQMLKEFKEKYIWAPLIVLSVIIVILLFKAMVVPALYPSKKGVTSVIEESQSGDYWRDMLSDKNYQEEGDSD